MGCCLSACPHVRLNFFCKTALGTCFSVSVGWELWCCGLFGDPSGGQWPLSQGAEERRWLGLMGVWLGLMHLRVSA